LLASSVQLSSNHSREGAPSSGRGVDRTYVACLDCGKELPYDWQEMKVITSRAERREYVAALATKHAA
jgi:hypothetical protein